MGHTDYGPLIYGLKTADKDETDIFFLEVRGEKGSFTLPVVLENSLEIQLAQGNPELYIFSLPSESC